MIYKIFISIFIATTVMASDPRSVYKNRSGIDALNKNQTMTSQSDFLKALETEPEDARLHMNLGLAYQAAKDNERAIKEYQTGLKFAKDPEVKFYGNFNTAQAIGGKNVDLALRYYQEALNYRPDSTETKHNIELLLQGKGGGEGEDKSKDKDKEGGEGEDKGQDRTNQQSNEPQPYKGKDLTPQDVQNILDELKNQDQKVRAKENSTGKDRSLDKDW